MLDANFLNSIIAAGSIPIIVGLVQVLKKVVPDKRWYGLMAVFIGVLINVGVAWGFVEFTKTTIVASIFQGIIAGLAANGTYSNANTIKKNTEV